MTNEEWFELYRFARQSAEAAGVAELELTSFRRPSDPDSGKVVLEEYLEDLAEVIRSRTAEFPKTIVRLLNEHVVRDGSGSIEALAVEISEGEDRIAYREDELALVGSSDFDEVLADITEVLADIRAESNPTKRFQP